jgi:hypothetical protein
MARISRLGRRDVSEGVGEIYDRYVRQRGNVPNMFRTVAGDSADDDRAYGSGAQYRHFTEDEIVELMAASGSFNYFNRSNNLLAVKPTPAGAGVEPATIQA